MNTTVCMPRCGLTMTEGTVTRIHAGLGANVKAGDIIMEFETDKITGEVTAECDGKIVELYAEEGKTYLIKDALCVIGDDSYVPTPKEEPTQEVVEAGSAAPEEKPDQTVQCRAQGGWIPATPYARMQAKENGVDLSAVAATGCGGAVTSGDLKRYMENCGCPATHLARKIASAENVDLGKLTGSGPHGRIQKEDIASAAQESASPATTSAGRRVRLTAMRRTIAERMATSKLTIPHVYFQCDVDASALLSLKNKNVIAGNRFSVNDIILFATARALKEFDVFSGRIVENEIVYADGVHLGFAVSLGGGLIVPVIRHAEEKTLGELSAQAHRLTEKARAGKLTAEEYTGGIFTVSNLGAKGIDSFTAIINPPESGILAVGSIIEKVIVRNGQIAIKPMMTVTLSVDHSLIDGDVAAAFLCRIREILENELMK